MKVPLHVIKHSTMWNVESVNKVHEVNSFALIESDQG